MDCPFQVGDEVVRFRALFPPHPRATVGAPPVGHVGRVVECGYGKGGWIELDNWPHDPSFGLSVEEYRKVERKTDKQSLTEWLSQPAGDTDRIDRSAPIAPRKRERAS